MQPRPIIPPSTPIADPGADAEQPEAGGVEGRGHLYGDPSDPERHPIAAERHVSGGKGGDTEGSLGEQQGKESGRLVGDGYLLSTQ
ncbi:hypothetical protein R6L23_08970 [Streptomyces sp. SR27]|uniref:hypothetical protein n=1 Tax=Streptomyces sp. SR27 TaxID=3076630 RepID=UPI00295AA64C|nr:hypothetical protein [Streptomyces sp. SR27]MDV9188348.1 hypothetical protein [Streptomyces sp. SR27]